MTRNVRTLPASGSRLPSKPSQVPLIRVEAIDRSWGLF
jgi:hypothetical protein